MWIGSQTGVRISEYSLEVGYKTCTTLFALSGKTLQPAGGQYEQEKNNYKSELFSFNNRYPWNSKWNCKDKQLEVGSGSQYIDIQVASVQSVKGVWNGFCKYLCTPTGDFSLIQNKKGRVIWSC